MDLYVLRHGVAADRAPELVDAGRELTEKGKKRLRKIARVMREMGLTFDLILTSPYARAHGTAKIVAEELDLAEKMEITTLLEPGNPPSALIDHLAGRRDAGPAVLLVGHEPMLSALISLLVCGTPDAEINLKKGGLCKLTVRKLRSDRCASLDWLLTPGQLIAGSP